MPVNAPQITKGEGITARFLTTVAERATGLFNSFGGGGIKMDVSAGGLSILGKQVLSFRQPGTIAEWENVDSAAFAPFDVVQLTEPIQVQSVADDALKTGTPLKDEDVMDQSVLQATVPRDWSFGRFGICLDAMEPGEIGRGWLSGVTFCKVARANGVYAESRYIKKPDRADTVRGETYLQMSEVGAAEVLWIMEPLNPDPGPRPAIVRFGQRNTSGIGLYQWGNDFNGGICEVMELDSSVTVTRKAPGVVRLDLV